MGFDLSLKGERGNKKAPYLKGAAIILYRPHRKADVYPIPDIAITFRRHFQYYHQNGKEGNKKPLNQEGRIIKSTRT